MGPTAPVQPPSGRIVRAGQGADAGWAFVPDPLPPAPALLALAEVAPALATAERALHELALLTRQIDGSDYLTALLVRREAVASLRLEGSRVTTTDLYAYEAGPLPAAGLPAASDDDLRAVLNYERAQRIGLERTKTAALSLRVFSELHEELLEGCRGVQAVPGVFRAGSVADGPGPPLTYGPLLAPPPGDLRAALDAFERYLQTEDAAPPLLRAALLHYQFLAMHPFPDATALLARLLPPLALARAGIASAPLLSVSACLARRTGDYHAALWGVTAQGAWTDWVRFFLRSVAEAARDAAARLVRLGEVRQQWQAQLARVGASEAVVRLADGLFASPFLTFPLAQQRLGGNYRAGRFAVQRLAAAGIVQPAAGGAFRKVFVAGAVLQTIEE